MQTRDHEHKKMVDQKHLILLISNLFFFFRCLEGKRDVTKAIKFYRYCYFTAQLLRGCRLASSPLSILTRADHIYCLNFPTDRQLTAPCFVARGMQVGPWFFSQKFAWWLRHPRCAFASLIWRNNCVWLYILYVSITVFNFPPLVGFFENAFCKVNHFFNIKNSNVDNVLFF